ncbi:Gastrin-releasing peptide [Merluccius polli]|uniref:Gastrin-releasing peptide n=1 Tax=Merluccius polli TaxID=89951 RepID=A0AA47M4C6_MERPO|nr:Gastrin-releasing peptide [Merluccius polli]
MAEALCVSFPWTCRPVLLHTVILLATLPLPGRCSHGPATLGSKSFPRGNHWAVGHLMGRKSVEMLPDPPQEVADYPLTSSEPRDATLDQQYPSTLDRALFGSSHHSQRQTDRRFVEKTKRREEARYQYLREV